MKNSISIKSIFKKNDKLLNILQTVVDLYLFSFIVINGHFDLTLWVIIMRLFILILL